MNRGTAPRRTFPFLIASGLTLILFAIFYLRQNLAPQSNLSAVPASVNYAAPEMTLSDLQGKTHSLADYRGQVVLVNLWATWCPPCKEEMPALQAFYNKYNKNGFTILAINDAESKAEVTQFVQDYQLTFPIWLDPNSVTAEQAFKTINLPSSYLIDRSGTVRLMWVGGINRANLNKYVKPIIMENQ